jgi:hypothetical protein
MQMLSSSAMPVDNFFRSEPEVDFAFRSLFGIAAVNDVSKENKVRLHSVEIFVDRIPSNSGGKVTTNCAWGSFARVGGTENGTASIDHTASLPNLERIPS